MAKKILLIILLGLSLFVLTPQTHAQILRPTIETNRIATDEAKIATESAKEDKNVLEEEDLTRPEEEEAKKEFIKLFSKRPIENPDVFNFGGFIVQYAVRSGVPANTIILILLLPFLATLVVIFRQIIGLPTLEMLVPIALSITLIATGLTVGAMLLGTILFASIIARLILKRIRIMQLPKMAISMSLVSLFVFVSLTVSASLGLFRVDEISFFPVLILVLLSDKIVGLQLARGNTPAVIITFFTLFLGALGYVILAVSAIRDYVLLYPEITLLLLPINLILGRYFGLRLTEYHRFASFRKYVNQ